jgi:6-phosphogluconolactonase
MNNPPRIIRSASFVEESADLIISHGKASIERSGLFRLGLAGGNTPRAIYEALAARTDCLPWNKVQITFGDERCVAPNHADSNYRMASESLLSRVSIPEGNVFRVRGEADPEEASQECEARLQAVAARLGEPIYRHDLMLLGMGPDGHTASLFPGSPALEERTRWVIPTIGPKPPPQRITFTFPLLNASRYVMFLVNDASKEAMIQEAIQGRFPAGCIRPQQGEVIWLIGL